MNLTIRPMRSADLDSVYAIELAAHRSPWTREILSDCILVGYDCRVLELEQDNTQKIIGYIISRYYANFCHVLNLCVAPQHQAKGHGRHLLQDQINSLINTSYDTMLLEVRPSNPTALSLYQQMGFRQVGIKEKYYCDDFGIEDAVLLEKLIL